MLCLGSIGMDRFISESYYKGTILQRNFFVKFHVKKNWEPQHDCEHIYPNPCYNEDEDGEEAQPKR